MSGMFDFANQDIGNWDASHHDMSNMFSGDAFHRQLHLLTWSQLSALQSTVQFHAGDSEFCNVRQRCISESIY